MKQKIQKTILGGSAATAVMTLVTFMAPLMGMPEMNPAAMLSGMMGAPLFVGWAAHFMIGIIFAAGYAYLFAPTVRISNWVLRGGLFGFAVFVFAQIMMAAMGALMEGMPAPEGSMVLLMLGSIMGHVIYGIVVGFIVSTPNSANTPHLA